MSLGLLREDIEMLNVANDIIEKLTSSSPDPCTPVAFCGYSCQGSCTGSCSGGCSGGSN
jgi:hypothetical protein